VVHFKQKVDFLQRSISAVSSALAGHLISTNPLCWSSEGSVTQPSGDAPIQFAYKLISRRRIATTVQAVIPAGLYETLSLLLMPEDDDVFEDIPDRVAELMAHYYDHTAWLWLYGVFCIVSSGPVEHMMPFA